MASTLPGLYGLHMGCGFWPGGQKASSVLTFGPYLTIFELKIPDFHLEYRQIWPESDPLRHISSPSPLVIEDIPAILGPYSGLKASLEPRNRVKSPVKQPKIPDFRLFSVEFDPISGLRRRMVPVTRGSVTARQEESVVHGRK